MKVSDKGSMEMDIFKSAVKHIAKFIKEIFGNQQVLLTRDGHSFGMRSDG